MAASSSLTPSRTRTAPSDSVAPPAAKASSCSSAGSRAVMLRTPLPSARRPSVNWPTPLSSCSAPCVSCALALRARPSPPPSWLAPLASAPAPAASLSPTKGSGSLCSCNWRPPSASCAAPVCHCCRPPPSSRWPATSCWEPVLSALRSASVGRRDSMLRTPVATWRNPPASCVAAVLYWPMPSLSFCAPVRNCVTPALSCERLFCEPSAVDSTMAQRFSLSVSLTWWPSSVAKRRAKPAAE